MSVWDLGRTPPLAGRLRVGGESPAASNNADNGQPWRLGAAPLGVLVMSVLAIALVNAVSASADLASRGVSTASWEPYVWEFSSALGVFVAIPPLELAKRVLGAARRALALQAAYFLGFSVLFSVVHVTTMVVLRWFIYGLAGRTYDFGPVAASFLYEYRKDALTFGAIVAVSWLWRRALRRPPATRSDVEQREQTFFAPSADGGVVLRAPEIDWVEAQGNYVALHARGHSYLVRQPLKALDNELRSAKFIRTHRSALVNTRRVRGIGRSDDGALRVELANSEFAPLSDRRKAEVVKALSAL